MNVEGDSSACDSNDAGDGPQINFAEIRFQEDAETSSKVYDTTTQTVSKSFSTSTNEPEVSTSAESARINDQTFHEEDNHHKLDSEPDDLTSYDEWPIKSIEKSHENPRELKFATLHRLLKPKIAKVRELQTTNTVAATL